MNDILRPQTAPPVQKMKFTDVFAEDKKTELLTLQVMLKIEGQDFQAGLTLRKGEKMGNIDFHILRYLDIAVAPTTGGYELKGFFPQK